MSFYDEHTDDEDYVSDGELVVLENLTKIPWRDYESYLKAVNGYDRGGYDIHGNSRLSGLSRFPKL